MPRFLNRLLGIPSKWQRKIFDLFSSILDTLILQAKREMSYDQGKTDLCFVGLNGPTVVTMPVVSVGIMEIRAAQMTVENGFPKQVWGDGAVLSVGPASATGTAVSSGADVKGAVEQGAVAGDAAGAGAKGDVVMHYSIKVDRYEHRT